MEQEEPTTEKKQDWTFKEFFSFILMVVVIVLPIRIFIAQPFIVSGESMDPTFVTGQYLIVDQLTYRLSEPSRGDVVVFRLPAEPSRFLIKRLIALPGETVRIEENDIFIKTTSEENGDFIKIEEDFITHPKAANLEVQLAEDEYFLLGDNRANSLDSRFFGSINEKFIVGRALIRLFPFSEVDWMPGKFEI